jgi:hypothetical protein
LFQQIDSDWETTPIPPAPTQSMIFYLPEMRLPFFMTGRGVTRVFVREAASASARFNGAAQLLQNLEVPAFSA